MEMAKYPNPFPTEPKIPVERVQTGVRLEKRLLKVLKALAERFDITLGQLLEDILLHALEGPKAYAFGDDCMEMIRALKQVYGLDYDTHDCYRLEDTNTKTGSSSSKESE